MGKFDVTAMRYLESEHFRVLLAIEMGMKNHEVVPLPLVSSVASLHRGAAHHVLADLVKNRLACYERGKRYDGYRLTVLGYDYLALRALCARDVVGSVGNQIGIGKESDVYVAGDPERNDLVIKLHRLGRTSFRKIKEKRDYHKKRHYCSWLYLSRIAAIKEFAFLKALHERKFPVPRPVDVCRHVVVMGLIDGLTLCHVDKLPNVGEMYDKLMALIVRLARYGVIHSDFNEFNIMVGNDLEPIMIDFPQMVSIDHPNAEYYFNRDVQCVRDYFKRKFEFDCDNYPKFDEIERKHSLDVEVQASGFTREMALDLNTAYDKGDFEAHVEDAISEEDEDEEEEEEEAEKLDRDVDPEEIAAIDDEAREKKSKLATESRFTAWIEAAQEQVEDDELLHDPAALEVMDDERQAKYQSAIDEVNRKLEAIKVAGDGNGEEGEQEEDGLAAGDDATTAAAVARGKVTKTRSVYSTGSTIAPDEIKKRLLIEKSHAKRERIKVKGRQCAVNRGRRANRDLLKEYEGWL